VAYAALGREGAQYLQILLMKAERDLLGARWANLNIEVLQILSKLLDAVTRPEVTLFSVVSERWDLALPGGCCTH
jgi:hypothetical protein